VVLEILLPAPKLKLKVLESPGEIFLKVIHFSTGSNGKPAAIAQHPVYQFL